ncbi:sterol 3-beta-glucosyltransferase UGT80A2-like isoform X1 [Zea mays]|uniref:sterol 3beta-glucosyltransferase n=1 Tax=Zea mays TaxID=4577 RepID=A0A1D6EFI7_MAIZE|nr:sterol 3-beta-glucosyltransferase UGT80A2-like isoform X1 [Zea mays]ONM18953.1 Sterol 3-beta-glucosyltransferase UGT80A2 [Zea mays]|eukprot:XP_020403573.1 sterol 3-beta-glucosyltransferase UGT80A2-like isoform X1 [Zea mays]
MADEEGGSGVAGGRGGEALAASAPNGDRSGNSPLAVPSFSADDRGFHRSSTMPLPVVIKNDEIANETAGPSSSERSRTERRRQNNPADDPAKQLLDERIPIKKKLKMLDRIATVKDDGTVVVDVPSLEPTIVGGSGTEDIYTEVAVEDTLDGTEIPYRPPMQIVILIVGTRGDVQPFVAIGKRLQDYGHRVRLATHANFKEFVLTAGLEFFPLGGDPKILAEFMVKNKGFLPSGPSEIPIQRKQMKEIIFSLLPACKEPDPDTGIPFKVDAIIANPPAYGHTHVAEALKVPIHILFTMPWTPTSKFPHPFSRVKQPAGYRLSYQIVDSMIWLGIRDMINEFRKKKLKLRPVTYLSGSQGSGNDIPHGYIWSPHLVPKPKDWGPKIDVVGFCFLDLASNYVPPEPLVKWLQAGDKPIYVGFGSLPVQDPQKMTEIIVKALEITGQRGIINKGWGGLGTLAEPKDFVYLLDNCPHDWLFLQCKAVVHHGGAGTTAAGLKAACPTTIVPFFGDQPFWGDRVHARGLGPPPIPVDQFGLQKLVDAIKFMTKPVVKDKAVEVAKAMESEDGVTGAVRAFLRHLPSKTEEPSPPQPSGFLEFFLGPLSKCLGCS